MAATTNFQVTGIGKVTKMRIEKAVADAIGSRPGRWRVQLIGHQEEDVWELRVSGPAVEASEYLDRTLGQHEPEFIASLVQRIASE